MNRFNIGFKLNMINNIDTTLRSNLKIKIPFYNKAVGQLKLDYRAAIMFNMIPSEILELLFYNHAINKKFIKELVQKINFKADKF